MLGDHDYSNINTADVGQHVAARESAFAMSNQATLRANVSQVYTWSDHDFRGGNSYGTDPTPAGLSCLSPAGLHAAYASRP